MRSAAVSGATGFIGGNLLFRLREYGVKAVALGRHVHKGAVRSVLWDMVADPLSVPELTKAIQGVDVVFQLAGKSHALDVDGTWADWEEYRRINTEGTLRLAEAAVRAGVRRFVFFSSVKAIGADEGDDPYGQSKLEAERGLAAFADRMEIVILRPAMVYGPTTKGNLPRMIRAVARGWFPPVPDLGRRSMVHVDDVVQVALLSGTKPEAAGKTYVVTDGVEYTTRKIHAWICEALGRTPPRWSVPMPALRALARAGDWVRGLRGRRVPFDSDVLDKLIGEAWYDGSAIRRELGFEPEKNLRDSLPDIIAHLQTEGVV